jgi:hypothetical protein
MQNTVVASSTTTVQLTDQACGGTIDTDTGILHSSFLFSPLSFTQGSNRPEYGFTASCVSEQLPPRCAAYSLTMGNRMENYVVDLSGTATGTFATKQTLEGGTVCDKRTMSSSDTVTFTTAGTAIFSTVPSPSPLRKCPRPAFERIQRFSAERIKISEGFRGTLMWDPVAPLKLALSVKINPALNPQSLPGMKRALLSADGCLRNRRAQCPCYGAVDTTATTCH